ncbi:alpha/beta fold hydrolase [Nocardioides sp. CER19]|uniref:alpha/beta hydrolase family protein n=1 Tax=Nocardioides sp. CER19 TaxID=3038538 RepID=UPI002447A1D0|nr:alpha/beta fold hydrolase [Nocardioides sp. CER19]MDH2413114.1 prolyl oligopeptidase family serine peptidase [Nocardioides sp. CER19]
MFEYFPGNYIWNLGVAATLNSGGLIDEVDRACRPIRELAKQGSDVGTAEFMRSWQAVADQLEQQAAEAEKAGHLRTAGQKYFRAAAYLCQAERMQSAKDPGRKVVYQHLLELMEKSFELVDPATTRVAVPFEGGILPAYLTRAERPDGSPAPTVIMWNGLDSTKEHMYCSGWPAEMAARGISVLQVDCPGSGEALRFADLKARVTTEDWAAACVDYLETRDDVDHSRIGLVGWSLGGYYVPRAAAFEKRLALAVAWGANHNWGEVQKARLEREGENPVPHYWDHVLWVWGYDDIDAFIEAAEAIHLNGVVEQITCPFLITHGSNDRQINVEYAHQSYDQAVHSPRRELRVFTPEEGATEHIGLDHLPHVGAFTADWIEDVFTGR